MHAPITAPKSAWQSLLWKDFQQVKPALLAIVGSLVGIQILAVAVAILLSTADTPFASAMTIACMGPVLTMMACIGLLIGHERQAGSWAWSSSLPMGWLEALRSKVAVSIGASALTLLPLALVPLTVYSLGYRLESEKELEGSGILFSTTLLIAIDVGVFLAIAVLLFRETLTGLIVGALFVVVGQLVVVTLAAQKFISPLLGIQINQGSWAEWSTYVGLLSLGFLLACIIFVLTFRWRWSFGQSSEVTWRRSRIVTAPRSGAAQISETYPIRSWRLPAPRGEFAMLLAQSWRVSLVAKLCVTFGALAISLWIYVNSLSAPAGSDYMVHQYFAVLANAAGLLGILTFEGDQSSRRFSFLADRGVATWKFVTARVLVTLSLAAFCLCIVVAFLSVGLTSESLFNLYLANVLGVYVLGVLSSICFQRPIIGLVVGIMSVILVAGTVNVVVYGAPLLFAHDVSPHWFSETAICFLPLSLLLAIVALYWLAKKWMVQDTPKLEWQYTWLIPTLIALPLMLTTALGFLFLPNVPMQLVMPAAAQADALGLLIPPLGNADLTEALADENVLSLHALDIEQRLPGWKDRTEEWIAAIEEVVEREPKRQLAYVQVPTRFGTGTMQSPEYVESAKNLESLMRSTANLGYGLGMQGMREQALRIWKCNKRLQEFDIDAATLIGTLEARKLSSERFAAMAYEFLSIDRLKRQQPNRLWETLQECLPDAAIVDARQADKMRYWVREQTTSVTLALRDAPWSYPTLFGGSWPWPIRVVPTLRWRQERSLALQLGSALHAIDVAANRGIPQSDLPKLQTLAFFQSPLQHWNDYRTARRGLLLMPELHFR